jgi:NAD(P)-dependent dehydrogenase (short-subunit alcohol dehydrogenase family)
MSMGYDLRGKVVLITGASRLRTARSRLTAAAGA